MNAVRNANGDVSKTLYDLNENVIERVDAKGNSGVNTYDKLNRLIKTVNPEGVVTEFTLSESGRLLLQSTRYFDPDHSPQNMGTGIVFNFNILLSIKFYALSSRAP